MVCQLTVKMAGGLGSSLSLLQAQYSACSCSVAQAVRSVSTAALARCKRGSDHDDWRFNWRMLGRLLRSEHGCIYIDGHRLICLVMCLEIGLHTQDIYVHYPMVVIGLCHMLHAQGVHVQTFL